MLSQVESHRALLAKNRVLEHDLRGAHAQQPFDSRSPSVRAVYEQAALVAPTEATVLITGANGTGKEVMARWIQAHSPRHDRPFVTVNCAALPRDLIEAELFGHAKGAYTGADRARRGFVEAAHGGTLFLDEVAEIPPEAQVKLLRLLQEHDYVRLGETTERHADIRLLAATNRDLRERLDSGDLREDFYYRLNVFHLRLPHLRERPEDIRPLFERVFADETRRLNKPAPPIDEKVFRALEAYPWPGNIRELRNLAERLAILSRDAPLAVDLLPEEFAEGRPAAGDEATWLGETDYRSAKRAFERRYLEEQLRCHNGNMAATARSIGLHPVSLRQKVAHLGIDARRLRSRPST